MYLVKGPDPLEFMPELNKMVDPYKCLVTESERSSHEK